MEVTTIIAAIAAAIEVYKILAKGDDRGFTARLEDLKVQAEKHGEAAFDAALKLYDEVATISAEQSRIRARAEAARVQNPAFHRIVGAGTLVLSLVLCLGCQRLTKLEETPTLKAGYAYEWPEDASADPGDYHTVEVDGRMVTTTPRR